MTVLNHEELLANLNLLLRDDKKSDHEFLYKLLVLNSNPGEIHGFRTRTLEHVDFLRDLNPSLNGRNVYFAGDIAIYKNQIAELCRGGSSLERTGYCFTTDNYYAVHGLLGLMFKEISQSGYSLRKAQ
jgi:hypothetical protein